MKITRSDTSYADLVEIFRCEVRSVWPFYSIEFDSELLEEFDILQRFEDFPLERREKIGNAYLSVVEEQTIPGIFKKQTALFPRYFGYKLR